MPASPSSFSRTWLLWFAGLAVPLLLAMVGLLWLARGYELDDLLAREIDLQRQWQDTAEQDTQRIVNKMLVDALYLQREENVAPALDGDEDARQHLQRHMTDFVAVQQVYLRARLFDTHGRERVRVDLRGGVAQPVPDDKLQDKVARPYVLQANTLEDGQLSLSGIELSVENGKLVRPPEPVMRSAAPVFAADGRRLGSVVLSYRAQRLLDWLGSGKLQNGIDHWALAQDGSWMLGGELADRWYSMLQEKGGAALPQRNPQLWAEMQHHVSGVWHGGDGVYVYRVLRPFAVPRNGGPWKEVLAEQGNANWYLVARIAPAVIETQLQRVDQLIWSVGLLGALAVLALSGAIATIVSVRARRVQRQIDAERRVLELLQNAPVGAYVSDLKGRNLYVNPYWSNLTGLSPAEALGDGWRRMLAPDDPLAGDEAWARLMGTGKYNVVLRFVRADGTPRWGRLQAEFEAGRSAWYDRYVGVMLDVTEQVEAERALRESLAEVRGLHDELDSILGSTADPILTVDRAMCITHFNRAYANATREMFGREPQPGMPLADWLALVPEMRDDALPRWQRVLKGEYLSQRAVMGRGRIYDLSYSPRHDGRHNLIGGVLIMHDVTEINRTQAALQRREMLSLSALNSSPDVILLLESFRESDGEVRDFVVVDCNLAGAEWLNKPLEHIVNARLSGLLPREQQHDEIGRYTGVFRHGGTAEDEFETGDGRWWLRQVRRWHDGVVVRISDITSRQHDQQALAQSLSWQNAVLDAAPFPVIATDSAGWITLMNATAERLLDYPPLESLSAPPPFEVLLDPREVEQGAQRRASERRVPVPADFSVFRVMAEHGPAREEWVLTGRDGVQRPVMLAVTAVKSPNGSTGGYLFIARDLAELKRIERRLVESEQRNSRIVDNIREGLVIFDDDGCILQVNPAACAMFGYREEAMTGMPLRGLVLPEEAERMQRVRLRQLAGERAYELQSPFELTGCHVDGRHFPMEVTISELTLEGQRCFVAIVRDISERKEYEARLHQTIDELELSQKAARQANDKLLAANLELQRLAQLDGLTGVPNRRFFDQQYRQEWLRGMRESQPLSVVMIDVDHFKAYNDNYGHQAGDDCLKQIAAGLSGLLLRPGDLLARYGGEEFVAVLPNTDREGARQVAERMCEQVAAMNIPHSYSSASSVVTISCGVATRVPEEEMPPDALIQLADMALYAAKRGGRNRTVAEDGSGPAELIGMR
ncbi:PAS domain S-box-containing protein/diguanylate cyclase (GGDEF) domain-containing protein [Andreprevotia lacus DSM 23236]|jgi:diguanylate cyclase (GGDEF)-like protein/PAS domain S-box-containing protein|uniref:PAS domain S-box-containing protein/diguanylate cyclase (GGDEF) domain-containing protein n=1 Tax=Andreprevotia lacus DSM 23236 TaxID=1121001 RepID=A0A1W1Y0M8_9NEIS|nr:PAS domain S-box protein [Andreprevotia lacus]SMC29697.1 PAS domain S-box-containing protein/diguanylate cyclase (GGDEF) domain-containing protein [Andreprevotia lacus DSM 23236]